MTYLCTYLQFGFGVLQFAHRIRDIVSADDCLALEHTARPPSADLHDHGFTDTGPPQIARRSPAQIMEDQARIARTFETAL